MADAWYGSYGLARLENLADEPPMNEVPASHMGQTDVDLLDYLRLLMEAGQRDVAPELIQDRQNLWLTYAPTNPPWMTLRTHVELYDYKKLLMDDLGIDNRALHSFVDLVRTKPYGYNEACKVLHHLLKDHFEKTWTKNASRWLHTSCTESIEAIKNLEEWNNGSSYAYPAKGKWAWPEKGGGGKGSSSSSGAWCNYVPPSVKGGEGKGSSSSSRGFR